MFQTDKIKELELEKAKLNNEIAELKKNSSEYYEVTNRLILRIKTLTEENQLLQNEKVESKHLQDDFKRLQETAYKMKLRISELESQNTSLSQQLKNSHEEGLNNSNQWMTIINEAKTYSESMINKAKEESEKIKQTANDQVDKAYEDLNNLLSNVSSAVYTMQKKIFDSYSTRLDNQFKDKLSNADDHNLKVRRKDDAKVILDKFINRHELH